MIFYTYLHTRNDTHAVFYVGKGKDNRAWCKRRNVHWRNIAEKHGYSVHILEEFDNEQDAFAHERYLIASFRSLGFTLSNATDGGDGTSGWHHSTTTKLKIKLSNTGKIRPPVTDAYRAKQSLIAMGRVKSEETCAKLRAALKGNGLGKTISAETRAKTSLTMKGRTFSEQHKANLRMSALAKPSMGMKGKRHSPETLTLMRARAQEREARKSQT